MSESDDYDLDSVDDSDSGSVNLRYSISPNSFDSRVDRRAHHNALERKRRDLIKDSFIALRDSIPALKGEKASRAQILKRAADYIISARKRICIRNSEFENSKKQNQMISDKVRQLLESGDSDIDVKPTVKIEPMCQNNEDYVKLYETTDDE